MKLFLIALLLNTFTAAGRNVTLDEIRDNYAAAVAQKQVCKNMIAALQATEQHAVYLAYLGAYQAIWANHTWNPFEKLSTFKKGKKNIEKAAADNPDELEIHFVRLSIQYNIPKMLHYSSDIETDKNYILANYKSVTSRKLLTLMLHFFEKTDLLTDAEYSTFSEQ